MAAQYRKKGGYKWWNDAGYSAPANWNAGFKTGDITDQLPTTLSPSRALDWDQCPALYAAKHFAKLVTWQNTIATTRGTLVHDALEQLMLLPSDKRTVITAVSFVEPLWQALAADPAYADIAALTPAEINELVASAEDYVISWFLQEDAMTIVTAGVELPVRAPLTTVVNSAADGEVVHSANLNGRLDRVDVYTEHGVKKINIIDYKTGKLPHPNYLDKAFFGLRLYAAGIAAGGIDGINVAIENIKLTLLHINPDSSKAQSFEYQPTVRSNKAVTKTFTTRFTKIKAAAKAGVFPCKTSKLCNWCELKKDNLCPAWAVVPPTNDADNFTGVSNLKETGIPFG